MSTYFCFFYRWLYSSGCYCCNKRGLKESFKEYLLDFYRKCGNIEENIRFIPFTFNALFIGTIFYGLFLHRRFRNENFSHESRENSYKGFLVYILSLIFLTESFVYFFHFIIIYIPYLIIILKNYKKYDNKNN